MDANLFTVRGVYLLYDPRDGQPKYVGHTNNIWQRYYQHCSVACPSKPVREWVDALYRAGTRPGLSIICRTGQWTHGGGRTRELLWIATLAAIHGDKLLNERERRVALGHYAAHHCAIECPKEFIRLMSIPGVQLDEESHFRTGCHYVRDMYGRKKFTKSLRIVKRALPHLFKYPIVKSFADRWAEMLAAA